MKTAFVFSGQGTQFRGMGQDCYEASSIYKDVISKGSEMLNLDLAKLMFDETEELNQTEFTQPAILAMSVGLSQLLKETCDIKPDITAGLSLGEYTALVESGALTFKEAIQLVRTRGRLMSQCVPSHQGGMAAVMGLSRHDVERICHETSTSDCFIAIANYNMPNQLVISGHVKGIEKVTPLLKEAGAKRVIPLQVSGPFHTKLLKPAAIQLDDYMSTIDFKEMTIPVVTNVTGVSIASKQDIHQTLVNQMMSPVYWEDSVRYMIEQGVTLFIEIGPGKALTQFIKKIDKNVTVFNVEDVKTLSKLQHFLIDIGGASC